MSRSHPELPAERAYLDRAREALLEMMRAIERSPEAGATPQAAAALRKRATERLANLEAAKDEVAFGRIDPVGALPLYLGRAVVRSGNALLVINWRAPAAAPFYTASHQDAQGLELRRRFGFENGRLEEINDERFVPAALPPAPPPEPFQPQPEKRPAEPAEAEPASPRPPDATAAAPSTTARPQPKPRPAVPPPPESADAVLRAIAGARTAEMRDIASTIQNDQYALISDAIDGVLMIQGGPGTGKTAVALHRAAWLLFNHQEELQAQGVLVVGPNRAFMEYVSQVLPTLGETSIAQADVSQLSATRTRGAQDEHSEARRLKGDPRMAAVLERAVEQVVTVPDEPLSLMLEGTMVTIESEEVRALADEARRGKRTHGEARRTFRERIGELALKRAAEPARPRGRKVTREELQEALERDREWRNRLERIFPRVSANELVRDLLSVRTRLAAATEGLLTADESDLLHRERSQRLSDVPWTEADLALIDEAEYLLGERRDTYGYVIVDETQDLTPMQLRMIGRRSRGRLTLVGDLAQATGVWPHDSWDELVAHLDVSSESRAAELIYGYRVPSQVLDLAGPIAPMVADVAAPRSVRIGPLDPMFQHVDEEALADQAALLAVDLLEGDRKIGIIGLRDRLGEVRAALDALGVEAGEILRDGLTRQVTLLTPATAKGLEFDGVVVIEPAEIVDDRPRGLAELYVALTRTTHGLGIVASRRLPPPLDVLEATPTDLADTAAPVVEAGPPVLTGRFSEALVFTKMLYGDRRRRGSATPYYGHLLAVAALVLEDGGNEDEAIAALLHDALEDFGYDPLLNDIESRFGARVGDIAAACADPETDGDFDWRELKREHLETLESAGPAARRVSLAEKLANARAILHDHATAGDALWRRMEVSTDDLGWYFAALRDTFCRDSPGPMADEFARAVESLLAVLPDGSPD